LPPEFKVAAPRIFNLFSLERIRPLPLTLPHLNVEIFHFSPSTHSSFVSIPLSHSPRQLLTFFIIVGSAFACYEKMKNNRTTLGTSTGQWDEKISNFSPKKKEARKSADARESLEMLQQMLRESDCLS
jgi:hypothetical protein